eukprot:COSAG04_NODE_18182_length_449_cov_0.660000_1_plen_115_part_01
MLTCNVCGSSALDWAACCAWLLSARHGFCLWEPGETQHTHSLACSGLLLTHRHGICRREPALDGPSQVQAGVSAFPLVQSQVGKGLTALRVRASREFMIPHLVRMIVSIPANLFG